MKNVLPFLRDLAENNTREWFQDNKKRYQQARGEFEEYITKLLPKLALIDKGLAGLEAKQCVFRIYRDVRFSSDKSPYKTNMGAAMTKGGRKSPYATYYFHVEPGNVFAAGGIWMPEAPVLKAMRQEVYYNADEFKAILDAPSFRKYFDGISGESLKRPPRDFPADFPDADLLMYKSYVTVTDFKDDRITTDGFMDELLNAYRAMYPFNSFINRALAEF